jgi:hypothetical protein
MAKPKSDNELNLLKRALKIAAVEAYQNELVDTDMVGYTIGTDKEYSTVKDWMDARMESWLTEAELKAKV